MQTTKLQDGNYQIMRTVTKVAPDGSSYSQPSIEIVSKVELAGRIETITADLAYEQSKMDAIIVLETVPVVNVPTVQGE
jgi:hypothetical protein